MNSDKPQADTAPNATTLGDLQTGDRARVTGFAGASAPYRRKLLAMGLTPGAALTVTRLAPMGDPVEISVRGFAMSLRRGEAAAVLVEKIS
jgi:ferrous iron transport protein A